MNPTPLLQAPLFWEGEIPGALHLLDQTLLPRQETYRECRDLAGLIEAIQTLVVRGAPAIGVAAAYGAVLAAQERGDLEPSQFGSGMAQALDTLAAARPTAVNLGRSVGLARQVLALSQGAGPAAMAHALLASARQLHRAEEACSLAMGKAGAQLLPAQATILTHCNTGPLAAPGVGTALGVVFQAVAAGKKVEVFASETRPLFQGLRLTTWELRRAGIPVTVLCEGAAGALLASGRIDAVLVGADRIAANGDVANKIGTYALAVLAARHEVPFYVVAPRSTFDFSLADGQGIPIETRDAAEILAPLGIEAAPRIRPHGIQRST